MVREGSTGRERRLEEEAEGTSGALSGAGLQGRPTSPEGCVSGGVQSSGVREVERGLTTLIPSPRKG